MQVVQMSAAAAAAAGNVISKSEGELPGFGLSALRLLRQVDPSLPSLLRYKPFNFWSGSSATNGKQVVMMVVRLLLAPRSKVDACSAPPPPPHSDDSIQTSQVDAVELRQEVTVLLVPVQEVVQGVVVSTVQALQDSVQPLVGRLGRWTGLSLGNKLSLLSGLYLSLPSHFCQAAALLPL